MKIKYADSWILMNRLLTLQITMVCLFSLVFGDCWRYIEKRVLLLCIESTINVIPRISIRNIYLAAIKSPRYAVNVINFASLNSFEAKMNHTGHSNCSNIQMYRWDGLQHHWTHSISYKQIEILSSLCKMHAHRWAQGTDVSLVFLLLLLFSEIIVSIVRV